MGNLDYDEQRKMMGDVLHVLILLGLIVVFWFVLVWTGVINCDLVPGGCGVYWGIVRFGSEPRVLIVYGDGGLGDHALLRAMLEDPVQVGARVREMHLDQVTIGKLQDYDLVIVEEAREMETNKLRAFVDYAIQGGRLVWTGDAGTLLGPDDSPLFEHERSEKYTCEDLLAQNPDVRIEKADCSGPGQAVVCDELRAEGAYIEGVDCISRANAIVLNPWARKDSMGRIINFDQLLGVEYFGDYCSVSGRCREGLNLVGRFDPEPEREHQLVRNMRRDLDMYVSPLIVEDSAGGRIYGGFGVTKVLGDVYATRVLDVEHMNTIGGYSDSAPTRMPIIVTSGMGEKVAYYALPPEQFVSKDPLQEGKEIQLTSVVSNLYYGMLGFAG